jgi:hypothetical protein
MLEFKERESKAIRENGEKKVPSIDQEPGADARLRL